ncbi:MAG: hypothetical protein JRH20_24600 [Deltaproteobacteria bacterium]|nr:hypothetical protein [Deltaproteobacteria bacterium]
MSRHAIIQSALFAATLTMATLWAHPAHARPYRMLVTRTPLSTAGGKVELGFRHQALWLGEGPSSATTVDPGSFHHLGATLRLGIIDALELGFKASAILYRNQADDTLEIAAGDVVVALQGRILHTQHHRLGLAASVTFPTGPSHVDVLPPFWADGTWDVEALLLYEAELSRRLRIVANLGYAHHGSRERPTAPTSFDVPDALRWDLGFAFHFGSSTLLFMEFSGRHYLREDLTPVWTDNQHLIALRPGIRVEVVPRFVIEVGVGVALTNDAREMFLLRTLLGFTYEFAAY